MCWRQKMKNVFFIFPDLQWKWRKMDAGIADSIFPLFMDNRRKACKIQAFQVFIIYSFRIWAPEASSFWTGSDLFEEHVLHPLIKTGKMKIEFFILCFNWEIWRRPSSFTLKNRCYEESAPICAKGSCIRAKGSFAGQWNHLLICTKARKRNQKFNGWRIGSCSFRPVWNCFLLRIECRYGAQTEKQIRYWSLIRILHVPEVRSWRFYIGLSQNNIINLIFILTLESTSIKCSLFWLLRRCSNS